LIESGHLSEAETVTRRYLDLHKNSADGHYLLGYILFKRIDPRASLAEYTEGAKYRRPTALDLEAVASDYVLLHDYTDADKWFTKSLEWDPGNWQVRYYLGRAKYNENRFEEAADLFRQCLEREPQSVKAEDNLGLSLEGLGRTEEALAAYKQAIEWERAGKERDAGPYLDLGSLLVSSGKPTDALMFLKAAEQRAPNDVRVHRELGKAYLHLNQLDLAQAELENSVRLAPDSAPTHFVLAQVYRKLGLPDKAKQEIERFTALGGSHSVNDPSDGSMKRGSR
jgi:tetratricopeptide (TPR) repeat protein